MLTRLGGLADAVRGSSVLLCGAAIVMLSVPSGPDSCINNALVEQVHQRVEEGATARDEASLVRVVARNRQPRGMQSSWRRVDSAVEDRDDFLAKIKQFEQTQQMLGGTNAVWHMRWMPLWQTCVRSSGCAGAASHAADYTRHTAQGGEAGQVE
eukprot:2950320-Amphidinium_carterae.2